MGRAARPRLAVVFLMILTVGLSLGLAAEDVLDAVYDELEAVPYEVTPLFSIAVPTGAARTTRSPRLLHLKPRASSAFLTARVPDTDANRPTHARISLTLLCTLLC